MTSKPRAAIIGCGRMGGTIDDEITYRHNDFILPYGHAPAYRAVDQVELVAAADIDEAKLTRFCDRFDIPKRYTDYHELIDRERPEIVSVTTHATARARPIVYACEHGVRGIYAEKALCASVAELDAIVEACRRNGTHIVYGAMRRYWAGFETARRVVASQQLGAVLAIACSASGSAFHTNSHFLDAMLYLLGDPTAVSVRAALTQRDGSELAFTQTDDGHISVDQDPGMEFAVVGLQSGQRICFTDLAPKEMEIVCAEGIIRNQGDSNFYSLWRRTDKHSQEWEQLPYPKWTGHSGTVAIIQDLVRSVRTEAPGRSNLQVIRNSMEVLFGMVQSHCRGGVKVGLPLQERKIHVDTR